MDRGEILDAARDVVVTREVSHGKSRECLARIAQLWTAYADHNFEAVDCAMMLALVKVARASTGDSRAEDHYVDIAGYASLAGELATQTDGG